MFQIKHKTVLDYLNICSWLLCSQKLIPKTFAFYNDHLFLNYDNVVSNILIYPWASLTDPLAFNL